MADSTRKIAILKSNETMMVRRYRAVEESEKELRTDCAKLKRDMANIENQGTVETTRFATPTFAFMLNLS